MGFFDLLNILELVAFLTKAIFWVFKKYPIAIYIQI